MNANDLFDKYEPSLQFNSIFWYSQFFNINSSFDNYNTKIDSKVKKFVSAFIILFTYLLLLFTFPISGWFVIKKINSLERCLVYRLGRRLPLKGPGFIIILPWVDSFDTISLKKKEFLVFENELILTSDGSLVEIQNFKVYLSISNVVKSITQVKDSQFNVKKLFKISFKNLIYSLHIDDLEKKLDITMSNFINNMNLLLSNWGWSICFDELPKIIIKIKSEPKNQVFNLLKSYFDPQSQNKNFVYSFDELKKAFFGYNNSFFDSKNQNQTNNLEKDEIIQNLEKIAQRYIYMNIFNYKLFNIYLTINDESNFYIYDTQKRFAQKTDQIENDKIHFTINCKTMNDFKLFSNNIDTSRIDIKTKF